MVAGVLSMALKSRNGHKRPDSGRETVLLDPYIVKAVSSATQKQLVSSFARLYPEFQSTDEWAVEMDSWLAKLKQKPGLALSTGRRNSERGLLTCSLLEVLGVANPKAARTRMNLAWDIINSPVGSKLIGPAVELDAERAKRGMA